LAISSAADVVLCTRIIIITRSIVIRVYAVSSVNVARIVGTRVVIITVFWLTRYAISFVAHIVRCAFVVIGTRSVVIGVNTLSGLRIASIIGTWVIIVTNYRRSRGTVSVVAHIILSASIVIIARSSVIGVHTLTIVVTVIIGTRVVVIAVLLLSSYAVSFVAHVVYSTSFIIGTRSMVIVVGALSGLRIARIIGTRVIIFANFRCSRGTVSVVALIILSASIVIIARSVVVGVLTFTVRIASIVGTQVVIVTMLFITGDAFSLAAGIFECAGIIVVTGGFVVVVYTGTRIGVAIIIGTLVVIVAVLSSTSTSSIVASIIVRTKIVIVT
jgi:hypothetical protein